MEQTSERRKTPRASVLELARELGDGVLRLVQQEIALAKQEFKEALDLTRLGAMLLAAGGLCALLALIMLLVLLVVLIPWHALTAGILTVVLAGLAGALLLLGKSRLRVGPPERAMPNTIASLKEDMEWAKRQLKRDER